jgi:hypothetical protein
MPSDRMSSQKSCSIDDKLVRMENSIERLERIIERHEEEIRDLNSKIPKKTTVKAVVATVKNKEIKSEVKGERKGRFLVYTADSK